MQNVTTGDGFFFFLTDKPFHFLEFKIPGGIMKSRKYTLPLISTPAQLLSCLSHSGTKTGSHHKRAGEKETLAATTARSGLEQPCHQPPWAGTILTSPSSAQPPKWSFQNTNRSTPLPLLTTHGQRSAVLWASPSSGSGGGWLLASPAPSPGPSLSWLSAAPQARIFSPHLHTWAQACLCLECRPPAHLLGLLLLSLPDSAWLCLL